MLRVAALTMVLGAAWLVGARAQDKSTTDKKPAEAAMKMPAPGPEMERLKFLIGNWDMTAEYVKSPMMPAGGKETGTYKAQLGPGGYSIIADFEADGPIGKEIGHEIFAWDPKQKAYIVFTVGNSFPGAVTGTSHWEGDNLVTEMQFEEGSASMHSRATYSNIMEKSVHMEESFRGPDGTYQVIWKGDATKK
jgi:hypothetical protein